MLRAVVRCEQNNHVYCTEFAVVVKQPAVARTMVKANVPPAAFALLALAVAQIFRAAAAFVPPPPATSSPCGRNGPDLQERGIELLQGRAVGSSPQPSATQAVRQDPLPPKDETFNPILAAREVLRGLDVPEDANRYERIGKANGGIWRSKVLGLLPATVGGKIFGEVSCIQVLTLILQHGPLLFF
ncbi:unnamed protein product [Ectocarpus fasciculatus]